ncbi:MAG: hypothetical protein QNK23_16550 [Crocinitomicaceae bacterium]|nr:hypothetical protein [Crocinitomicaceae bacterium]
MRSILAFNLILFLSFGSFSQVQVSDDFSYTVSNPYKVVDGMKSYFSRDGEVLSVKYGRGVFTFQKFSGENMNEVERKEVEKTTGFTAESFEQIGDQFYFFFSVWDKAAGKEQLFAREIDFDNCTFVDEGRLLFKVDGKVTGGFGFGAFLIGAQAGSGKFHFTKSFDQTKLIVQYRKKPLERNDAINKDVIGMHVYGPDMEEVWSKDVEMPYTEKKMNNLGYSIDSRGNTYVLAEVFKDETTKRKTKDGKPNYRLELLRIDGEDQSLETSEIEFGDKFITDVGFFEGATGEMLLAGYYGNEFGKGTDGMFMSRISEDGTVEEKVYYEIPVDVMKLYMSERKQERMERNDGTKDYSMKNMVLRELVFDTDGSITMYGERYYYTTRRNPKTGQVTYTYYYQEILVGRINGDGELAWMNKLPKNQVGSAGRGGMGYYVMPGAEEDYVLFLDNVNNIELPMTKYPKAHRDGAGGFLTGFKIDDETGDVLKVSLFDTKDAKGITLYQFNTGRITKIDDQKFVVECYKKKKEDVMVTVTLSN